MTSNRFEVRGQIAEVSQGKPQFFGRSDLAFRLCNHPTVRFEITRAIS